MKGAYFDCMPLPLPPVSSSPGSEVQGGDLAQQFIAKLHSPRYPRFSALHAVNYSKSCFWAYFVFRRIHPYWAARMRETGEVTNFWSSCLKRRHGTAAGHRKRLQHSFWRQRQPQVATAHVPAKSSELPDRDQRRGRGPLGVASRFIQLTHVAVACVSMWNMLSQSCHIIFCHRFCHLQYDVSILWGGVLHPQHLIGSPYRLALLCDPAALADI